MRKQHLLLKMLFLFLLVPTSITRAQTVTLSGTVYENQTAKSTFTTPQGNIKVYLPDDMAAIRAAIWASVPTSINVLPTAIRSPWRRILS